MPAGKEVNQLTLADIREWYTPRAALDRAQRSLGTKDYKAGYAVMKRVKTGQIATAGTTSAHTDERGNVQTLDAPLPLTANDWQAYSESASEFWDGDVTLISYPNRYDMSQRATLEIFGLRLSKGDVDGHFPQPEPPTPEPASEEGSGPYASERELQIWVNAFKSVYPNATEEFALKSARGFFQGKRVARDSVMRVLPPRRTTPHLAQRPEG